MPCYGCELRTCSLVAAVGVLLALSCAVPYHFKFSRDRVLFEAIHTNTTSASGASRVEVTQCNVSLTGALAPMNSGCVPFPALNENCPRMVMVEYGSLAGLGHKVQNWMQAALLSFLLNATLALPDFPTGSWHGSHEGVASFFGLDKTVCNEISLSHALTYTRSSIFEKFDSFWSLDLGGFYAQIDKLKNLMASHCFVLLKVHEYWIMDEGFYFSPPALDVFRVLQYRSAEIRARGATERLLFDNSTINVAVHIRVGDATPVSPDVFKAILTRLYLLFSVVPCRRLRVLHAFSSKVVPEYEQAFANFSAKWYDASIGAVSTLVNLMQADILITGGSTMSDLSAVLGESKAVIFNKDRFPTGLKAPQFFDESTISDSSPRFRELKQIVHCLCE